jgi:DNA-binding IclR family transcriptional regulator
VLRGEFKETVHLAKMVGNEIVYLEKLDGLLPIGMMGSRIGSRSPAHCTGLGKAMLACTPGTAIRQMYAGGLQRYTPKTITDVDELLQECACIRERGYAIDDEEHEPNVKCIAAAIRNDSGEPEAAISLSGPAERMTNRIEAGAIVDRVQEVAQKITTLMMLSDGEL